MLVLDTDHLSEIDRESGNARMLLARLRQSGKHITTTIVSAEEQIRGLLAVLNKRTDAERRIAHYARFHRCIVRMSIWPLLPWNSVASDKLEQLRTEKIRLGVQDLKIASIVLTNNATLLTRNLRDFAKVPGLRIENSIDG